MAATEVWSGDYLWRQLENAVLNPIRAFRLRYLPLLMVYFAYGALGLIAVAESFWVKKALTLSPVQLAELAVWTTLPWTVKMVFGELVDSVPILGSQRRAYVFIGAAFIAAGLLLLAGAAGGWLTFASPENLYRLGTFATVLGVVIQDVVADAMSTEVVDRENPDGTPRVKDEVDRELGMVQVLGRLALSLGMFLVAGLAGWIASIYTYETVFLLGLIIPLISVSGALLITLRPVERRRIDWRILGGGIAYGAFVLALAFADIPYNQEIVFVVSMAVVCAMLWRVIGSLDAATQRTIFYAAVIIFAYRAMPLAGQGYTWFTIDVLGFDEAFQGLLAQIGAGLALLGMWLFSDAITRRPVAQVLLWLTVITTVLSLPALGSDAGARQLDGAGVRFRRPHHRHHRHGDDVALRAAQHDPAAHADRHLCAGRTSRHVVRADGLADEPGVGRRIAADQIPERGVRGRSGRLRKPSLHRRHLSHCRISRAAGSDIRLWAAIAMIRVNVLVMFRRDTAAIATNGRQPP